MASEPSASKCVYAKDHLQATIIKMLFHSNVENYTKYITAICSRFKGVI